MNLKVVNTLSHSPCGRAVSTYESARASVDKNKKNINPNNIILAIIVHWMTAWYVNLRAYISKSKYRKEIPTSEGGWGLRTCGLAGDCATLKITYASGWRFKIRGYAHMNVSYSQVLSRLTVSIWTAMQGVETLINRADQPAVRKSKHRAWLASYESTKL
jgi:hypothetical protein